VAEGEIVAAAEALLRERPFRELTVDEVMRRTDLSRPSFYVYFRDRHHLILRVVEHLGNELRTMSQRWYTGSGDGPAQAREAMEGFVEVYATLVASMSEPRPPRPADVARPGSGRLPAPSGRQWDQWAAKMSRTAYGARARSVREFRIRHGLKRERSARLGER
jgi:AcrR family transcriptional regulator